MGPERPLSSGNRRSWCDPTEAPPQPRTLARARPCPVPSLGEVPPSLTISPPPGASCPSQRRSRLPEPFGSGTKSVTRLAESPKKGQTCYRHTHTPAGCPGAASCRDQHQDWGQRDGSPWWGPVGMCKAKMAWSFGGHSSYWLQLASQGGTLYPHGLNCPGVGPRLTQWAAVVSVGGACPTCRAPAPSPSTPNRKHGFCVAKPLITVCLWGQPMSRTSLRGTHTKLLGLVGPPCWLWQERCSRPPRSVAPPACHPSALEAAAPSRAVG